MTDTIIYRVVTNGGGIDGLDHTDKGGKVLWAGTDKNRIPSKYNIKGWYTIESTVVDLKEEADKAVRSLDPIARLALSTFPEMLDK